MASEEIVGAVTKMFLHVVVVWVDSASGSEIQESFLCEGKLATWYSEEVYGY